MDTHHFQYANMLEIIIVYKKKNWNFTLHHILCERNACANILVLAKLGDNCMDTFLFIILTNRMNTLITFFFIFLFHKKITIILYHLNYIPSVLQ